MSEPEGLIPATVASTSASPEAKEKITASYENALGKLTINFSLLHFVLERFGQKIWNLNGPSAMILTKDLQLKHLAVKLRASAEHVIPDQTDRKTFISILNRAENAAEKRNEFLHSLWIFEADEPVYCFSRKRGALEGPDAPSVDHINELSTTIEDIVVDFAKFKRRHRHGSVIGLSDIKPQEGEQSFGLGARVVPKRTDTP